MSFNGEAIIEQITPNLLRITGLSLDPQTSGTVGLHDSAADPDIRLPATLRIPPLSFEGEPVSLAARIMISINPVSGAPGPFTNLPPSIEKTGENTESFLATITNTKTDLPTQTLEIYVEIVVRPRPTRVGPIVGPIITINDLDASVED